MALTHSKVETTPILHPSPTCPIKDNGSSAKPITALHAAVAANKWRDLGLTELM